MAPFFPFGKKNKKSKSGDLGGHGTVLDSPLNDSFAYESNTDMKAAAHAAAYGPTHSSGGLDKYASVRGGYMKAAQSPRQLLQTQMAPTSFDGPTAEDYARWNNAPLNDQRQGYERAPSLGAYGQDHSGVAYGPNAQSHDPRNTTIDYPYTAATPVATSTTAPNKLRRRTVSGPTAVTNENIPLVPHPTASVKGEDPLKRMKYDLQIATFLLSKLKGSSGGRISHQDGGPEPLGRQYSMRRQNQPYHPVDPRNLVDPRIDGRHGTEFHQMHNHGLLMHPYAPGYGQFIQSQTQPSYSTSSSRPPRPASSTGYRERDLAREREKEKERERERRRSNDAARRVDSADGRYPRASGKRYASDVTPVAFPVQYGNPPPSAPGGPQPVFATFRKPQAPAPVSYSRSHTSYTQDQPPFLPPSGASSQTQAHPQPSVRVNSDASSKSKSRQLRKQHRQSMPATLKPEIIIPIIDDDGDAEGETDGIGPLRQRQDSSKRKVRFRGADSVIGSPAPAKAAFASLPQKSGR